MRSQSLQKGTLLTGVCNIDYLRLNRESPDEAAWPIVGRGDTRRDNLSLKNDHRYTDPHGGPLNKVSPSSRQRLVPDLRHFIHPVY